MLAPERNYYLPQKAQVLQITKLKLIDDFDRFSSKKHQTKRPGTTFFQNWLEHHIELKTQVLQIAKLKLIDDFDRFSSKKHQTKRPGTTFFQNWLELCSLKIKVIQTRLSTVKLFKSAELPAQEIVYRGPEMLFANSRDVLMRH